MSNHLIHETSPYLLQHAHNPVNWYPWNEEALQKARDEDKPILISIGYSACHWCHVMERESFEKAETAAFMNEHFINIKVDREERPDLDHIYMDAVQAMTGSGGWPLNVFLTPDSRPFYGGTYFPPVKAFNRSSWMEVLSGVQKAWTERREEIMEQAGKLTDHLHRSNSFGITAPAENFIDQAGVETLFDNLMKNADQEWGGFGKAPKFPQTFSIGFLLQYYFFTGSEAALAQVRRSLDGMLAGGIYDQAGGGLARYSTDEEWKVPHFEKMLYDNALFITVLADAWRVTKNPAYEKAIRATIAFLKREMMDDGGVFYAALDADSEGEEGRYYIWTKAEIEALLGEEASLFCEFFDVTEEGNLPGEQPGWEDSNILRKLNDSAAFCRGKGIDQVVFEQQMDTCLERLLNKRQQRQAPGLDDKILLGWNALMVTALCKAAGALGEREYSDMAARCFQELIARFSPNGLPKLHHTWKEGEARYPAFLDDYACLVQAALSLQEISSATHYLRIAETLTDHVFQRFSDAETGWFFYTSDEQRDLVLRKKEVYDGATPSGNSVMVGNLLTLSVLLGRPEWGERGRQLLSSLAPAVLKYPGSFGVWAGSLLRHFYGLKEVVIAGTGYGALRDELLKSFIPSMILQCSDVEEEGFPLLQGKDFENTRLAYVCRDYSCLRPVSDLPELLELLGPGA